ncbi:unnamed protein product, partial [Laminaria digitata]
PIINTFLPPPPPPLVGTDLCSLTWHYRDADPHFGLWQAKDMQIHMEDVLSNLPLEILQGNRMVEVRHQAANKSMVAEAVLKLLSSPQSLRERGEVDFVLCVGDDRSDEDMFQTVKRFRDHARESPTPALSPTSEDEVFSDDPQGTGDVEGGGSGSVSAQGLAMVGVNRKMASNAAVYTVHIGLEHSHADYYLENIKKLRELLQKFDEISTQERGGKEAGAGGDRGGVRRASGGSAFGHSPVGGIGGSGGGGGGGRRFSDSPRGNSTRGATTSDGDQGDGGGGVGGGSRGANGPRLSPRRGTLPSKAVPIPSPRPSPRA